MGMIIFGEEWGWGEGKAEGKKIYDAIVEAGGNFVDTANRYTEGTSEKLCGEFIANDRERIVLATTYALYRNFGHPSPEENRTRSCTDVPHEPEQLRPSVTLNKVPPHSSLF